MPVAQIRRESREQAKLVIRDLLAAAGGSLRGKVRLNKAFYFAHLYYWRDSQGILTDYPIVRLPFGPAIDDATQLLAELVGEGTIDITTSPNGPYEEYVYTLRSPHELDPRSPRTSALRAAIELVEGRTGADLSELTHEHSRTWQGTADGKEMSIYADLLTDEQLESARTAIQQLRAAEQ